MTQARNRAQASKAALQDAEAVADEVARRKARRDLLREQQEKKGRQKSKAEVSFPFHEQNDNLNLVGVVVGLLLLCLLNRVVGCGWCALQRQAEADAALVVKREMEAERALAANNLAAQRAKMDEMSAAERREMLDREQKIDMLLGMLEEQNLRMKAFEEKMDKHKARIDHNIGSFLDIAASADQ